MTGTSVHIADIPGGVEIANDQVVILGVPYVVQRIKIGFGDDGAYLDVAQDNPLPVESEGDEERALLFPPRALQYARDTSERMRVSVDTGAVNVNSLLWGSANGNPNSYSTGSPNALDAREIERTQSQLHFMQQRAKWSLT